MYTSDITDEITSFRTFIRQKKYFQQTTLTTLSNKHTDSKLLQFSEHAQQNKYLHYSHITTNKLSDKYILQEHRQKHFDKAKTKANIILHIQTHCLKNGKKIKTLKKSVLLEFVREIEEL